MIPDRPPTQTACSVLLALGTVRQENTSIPFECPHEANSAPLNLTVEKTVKPLKLGENVVPSEHNNNDPQKRSGGDRERNYHLEQAHKGGSEADMKRVVSPWTLHTIPSQAALSTNSPAWTVDLTVKPLFMQIF